MDLHLVKNVVNYKYMGIIKLLFVVIKYLLTKVIIILLSNGLILLLLQVGKLEISILKNR